MIGTDPENPSGFIISKKAGLVGLPATGWEYAGDGVGWSDDPSLTIV